MANKFFHLAGGPEEVLLETMERLRSMGHTVILFSMHHPKNIKTEYDQYFVSNMDFNHHSRLPWSLAKTSLRIIFNFEAKKEMERLIVDTKPDIAHLHSIYHQLSPSILLPLKKHHIPVVMTLHDFKLLCPNYTFMREENPCEECKGKYFYKAIKYKCVKESYLKSMVCALEMYAHRLNKTYIQAVDCFIALSRFTQNKLTEYGFPQERIKYLPNYVNVPDYTTNSTPKKYILFLGRLSEKNGSFNLVKVMRNLPDIKLKLAGEGEQRELIEDYIRENTMKNVELVGFLTGEKLKETIANCSFLVFPNNCYHNCPMSILECFSYAKPVVGTNLGGVPELVEDNKTGLLFKPGSQEDLAQKIERLYKEPELTKKLGQNALNKVKENHSKEKYYRELLRSYGDLIQNKKIRNHPSTLTVNDKQRSY